MQYQQPPQYQQFQFQQQPATSTPQSSSWAAPPLSAENTYIPPTGFPTPSSTDTSKDSQTSGRAKRFFGDTLVGRFARASVQTTVSTLKMPAALSPWGDNNPVTLPNVRYRDAILFTTFAFVGAPLIEGADGLVTDLFGADSFVSEIVSSGADAMTGSGVESYVLKYGFFQIVEQAIDKGIVEHMLPEEEKIVTTTRVKAMQVSIKHKLMGVDADIRFVGVYPSADPKACAKGWFCPYLFASARTPLIPRNNDFAIAQFYGPFLAADYALAHKLVAESANVLSLCEADPSVNIGGNRMVIVFTGLAPFRAGMWSTSRRPGCGTVVFNLFDGCPAVVVPVSASAPVCAWSPWTWAQMRSYQYIQQQQQPQPQTPNNPHKYTPEYQHEQICEWIDSIVAPELLDDNTKNKYEMVLGRAVSLLINGVLALEKVQPGVLGKVDGERAGIVGFRY
ncbi:hypothetical protein K402DRAFT_343548 [Aulographum hederae CBS 113979]|uniref:Uncharacterized protein n=1 Tax=Aulographum hederae CBS 113979 TaxID=1176131 RepID=A0A6G1GJG5_9PEZI|nr:hypothetical protein K402DRAFT_343548 [Aulographum hederae CBS 113979]